MDKKEKRTQYLAALFFIGGIVLIMVFIFTIGKDKGFSRPKFQVSVLFKNVGGLSEGAPTRLAGVNVGNVASIDFLDKEIEGRRVKVTLNIYNKYRQQLNKNVSFAIKTEGVLGEKLVEIYVIDNLSKIDLSQQIFGEDPLDVQDLAQVFSGAAESFTKTSDELSKIDMVKLSDVLLEASQSLIKTSNNINVMVGELQETTRKTKRLIDRVEQKVIEGNLFKVF